MHERVYRIFEKVIVVCGVKVGRSHSGGEGKASSRGSGAGHVVSVTPSPHSHAQSSFRLLCCARPRSIRVFEWLYRVSSSMRPDLELEDGEETGSERA